LKLAFERLEGGFRIVRTDTEKSDLGEPTQLLRRGGNVKRNEKSGKRKSYNLSSPCSILLYDSIRPRQHIRWNLQADPLSRF
jgi:hypothetical protein